MPFTEHPVFVQPEDEEHVIWRYLEATQFISVLQNRGLYFNRVDNFEDSFEGIFPKDRLEEEYIRNRVNEETGRVLIEEGIYPEEMENVYENAEDRMFNTIDVFRKNSYMNCWHMNNSESMAMWKSYISNGDGVIIKSKYKKLKSALDVFEEYTYRIGEVGYLSWFEDGIEDQLGERERSNWLYPYMYKQEEYDYEQEVRAIISYEARDKIEDDSTGFFVPTDLNELIDSVIVSPNSPPWSDLDFWKNICRKYKLRTKVEHSSLKVTPEDHRCSVKH